MNIAFDDSPKLFLAESFSYARLDISVKARVLRGKFVIDLVVCDLPRAHAEVVGLDYYIPLRPPHAADAMSPAVCRAYLYAAQYEARSSAGHTLYLFGRTEERVIPVLAREHADISGVCALWYTEFCGAYRLEP